MAEFDINGRTFRVEPMLATKALHLQARLLKVAGPGFAHMRTVLANNDEAMAVEAIGAIFSNCEPEEIGKLVREIAELAQIHRPSGQYEQVQLDADFTGKLGDLLQLVVRVIKIQFGDFFSELVVK